MARFGGDVAVARPRAQGGAPRARRRRPRAALDPHPSRRRLSLRRRGGRRERGAARARATSVARRCSTRSTRRWRAPRAASGAVAVLLGPAGIGKTRTAEELLQRAERRGFRTVLARCAGAEDAPPLWPWRRIVAALEAGAGTLRVAGGGERSAATSAADRFQLFAAITACVERAAARGPLCLALDDLHEADSRRSRCSRTSRPSCGVCRCFCVAGLRRDAFERRAELARERAQLLRCDLVAEHEVPPLDASEARDSSSPRARAPRRRRRWSPSCCARRRATRSGCRSCCAAGCAAPAAPGVRWNEVVTRGFEQVLRDRWLRLAPSTRSVLEAAAVLGEECDAALLAEVAKCEVDDALAEARAEGLLDATDPEATRHRFAHALFRDALAAGTPDATRDDAARTRCGGAGTLARRLRRRRRGARAALARRRRARRSGARRRVRAHRGRARLCRPRVGARRAALRARARPGGRLRGRRRRALRPAAATRRRARAPRRPRGRPRRRRARARARARPRLGGSLRRGGARLRRSAAPVPRSGPRDLGAARRGLRAIARTRRARGAPARACGPHSTCWIPIPRCRRRCGAPPSTARSARARRRCSRKC